MNLLFPQINTKKYRYTEISITFMDWIRSVVAQSSPNTHYTTTKQNSSENSHHGPQHNTTVLTSKSKQKFTSKIWQFSKIRLEICFTVTLALLEFKQFLQISPK